MYILKMYITHVLSSNNTKMLIFHFYDNRLSKNTLDFLFCNQNMLLLLFKHSIWNVPSPRPHLYIRLLVHETVSCLTTIFNLNPAHATAGSSLPSLYFSNFLSANLFGFSFLLKSLIWINQHSFRCKNIITI